MSGLKIVFICGSLEPGRDGVGDYTRMLSAELIKQGHEILMLALNDHFTSALKKENQFSTGVNISVCRIPSGWIQNERYEYAKKVIADFNPAWLSLQLVIYSFHSKGLPFKLGKNLSAIGAGRLWHIMFHETYIGFTKISPLKHKITGFFQRQIIKSLVKLLKPKLITTSNGLYQAILSKNKIDTQILSLFSNIPFIEKEKDFIADVFEKLCIKETEKDQFVITSIFGNLYPAAQLQKVLEEQLLKTEALGKKLVFICFGRLNNEGNKEYERLKNYFSNRVGFLHMGEQSEKNISALMQITEIAFSCTPEEHIGKSGVYAAYRLHAVPVITAKGTTIPEYNQVIENYNEILKKQPPSNWSVDYIANRFLMLIKNSH